MRHSFPLISAFLGAAILAAAPASHAATQASDVYARNNSVAVLTHDATPVDTGLVFTAGDSVTITASGLWNGGGCGDVDANGTTCFGNEGTTGINYFSLIGKIGTSSSFDNTWFKIGTSFSGLAASSGTLYLAFLDNDSFNNSGFVTALVTVPSVPEPSSALLMVLGMALPLWAARRKTV